MLLWYWTDCQLRAKRAFRHYSMLSHTPTESQKGAITFYTIVLWWSHDYITKRHEWWFIDWWKIRLNTVCSWKKIIAFNRTYMYVSFNHPCFNALTHIVSLTLRGIGRLWGDKALEGQAIVCEQCLAPLICCLLRAIRRPCLLFI